MRGPVYNIIDLLEFFRPAAPQRTRIGFKLTPVIRL